ncbi:cation:proton antiporter [Thermocoleostomius sinensis]|uniref:Cation:proton antiporter n=1 Tax=Thermocoleostomius sinensis A174 TaxID=2016057 RepID=A0A9E8ZGX4_9CYAN|nr:cation:proton antiporter [Thermocoleostomius sinensis]WAL60990.1 cation:proton antiporter [Thermocoleostomius sinensis A174]
MVVLATPTASVAPLPLTDPVYVFCVLLLIIGLAPLIGAKLRLPPLVVLIILGTVLGTNVLGVLSRDQQLQLLEKIGLLYIMLLAGMQMDLSNLQRLGSRALVFGLLTFAVPFSFGVLSAHLLGYALITGLLLGIMFSPHTLVSYPIVLRLGITRHEAVGVAVGGTVVTSILTLTGLSIVQAIASGGVGWQLWAKLLLVLPLLVLTAFWIVPRLGRRILQSTTQLDANALVPQFIFVLTCLFVIASATLLLGIDSIVGAFIAGLALNSVVSKHPVLMKQVEFVGNSVFIPCFLISVGVLCNPTVLIQHPENLGLAAIVIICAVGAKFLAAGIAGTVFKYSLAEIMTMLGLTMSRAALVLVVALYGMKTVIPDGTNTILSEGLFNAIIAYIIVTCLVGPLVTNTFGQRLALAEQSQPSYQDVG